jgi:hypothetical protein
MNPLGKRRQNHNQEGNGQELAADVNSMALGVRGHLIGTENLHVAALPMAQGLDRMNTSCKGEHLGGSQNQTPAAELVGFSANFKPASGNLNEGLVTIFSHISKLS